MNVHRMTRMPLFGENVRAAMRRTGLERDTLAAKLGVGETQVDKWLNAKANPRLTTILRLANALDVSVEQLIDGIDAEYAAKRASYDRSRLRELCGSLDDDHVRVVLQTVRLFLGLPLPHRGDRGPGEE